MRKIPCFIPFDEPVDKNNLPQQFTYPFDYQPHPLCVAACAQVQDYLQTQTDWEHNFGLKEGQTGAIIGKMFGVLLVENAAKEIGF